MALNLLESPEEAPRVTSLGMRLRSFVRENYHLVSFVLAHRGLWL